MKLSGLLAVSIALVSPAAFADKTYNTAAATVTHDCDKDGDAVIQSSMAKLTITGACKLITLTGSQATGTIASAVKVAITGAMNDLSIDAIDELAVTGANNKISWTKTVSAKKPKVGVTGTGNKVAQKKVEAKKDEPKKDDPKKDAPKKDAPKPEPKM